MQLNNNINFSITNNLPMIPNYFLSNKWSYIRFDSPIFYTVEAAQFFISGLWKFLISFDSNFVVQLRVTLTDNTQRSLGKMLIVNSNTTLFELANYFDVQVNFIYAHYKPHLLKSFYIFYKSTQAKPLTFSDAPFIETLGDEFLSKFPPRLLFSNSDLPGKTSELIINNQKFFIKLKFNALSTTHSYSADVIKNSHTVGLLTDTSTAQGFFRNLNGKTLCFSNSSLDFETTNFSPEFIKPLYPRKNFKPKIITLDIETLLINSTHVPMAVGIYTEKTGFHMFTDNNLVPTAIKFLMRKKFNGYHVYLHNFSGFDSAFLVKELIKLGRVEPIIRNSKLILLEFFYAIDNQEYKLTFNDSLLLLPSSLRNLCVSFNVKTKKYFYPFELHNIHQTLSIKSPKPDIKFYPDITLDEYNLLDNHFDSEIELRKYLKIDCQALYDILNIFFAEIFDNFKIDVQNFPTIASIAMAVFRTKYLVKNKIPIITGKMFDDLSQGYYGGIVDVIKPAGVNLLQYDCNSLYPFALLNDLPIGKPKHIRFQEAKDIKDADYFGFFKAKIDSGSSVIPLLPLKDGGKLFTPQGVWEGWYFSEELKYAANNGYNIQLTEGYIFESKKVFEGYINDIYAVKQNSLDPVKKNTAKLMLNSLYGRFGLNPKMDEVKIVRTSELDQYLVKPTKVESFIDDEHQLITFDSNNISNTVSISIAAAVTAYARLHLNKLKKLYRDNLYYTDTDSLILDCRMAPEFVGKGIGLFKLEYEDFEGAYVAPKVYAMRFKSGEEVVKVKGINIRKQSLIGFDRIKELLDLNNFIDLEHEVFRYSLDKGYVKTLVQKYKLRGSMVKRKAITDGSLIIGSQPIMI